jgi:WD40 repeat protein
MNFYDISEKKHVKTITAEQSLISVSFHSDGHTLVAGGMYGGLYVYDLRKPNAPKERLLGHESSVKYVDFQKEKDLGPNSSKYTSILPSSKNVMNTEPVKRDNPISTVPVLIERPVVVSTNNIDKHRSMSKVDSTSTLMGAQQPASKPL